MALFGRCKLREKQYPWATEQLALLLTEVRSWFDEFASVVDKLLDSNLDEDEHLLGQYLLFSADKDKTLIAYQVYWVYSEIMNSRYLTFDQWSKFYSYLLQKLPIPENDKGTFWEYWMLWGQRLHDSDLGCDALLAAIIDRMFEDDWKYIPKEKQATIETWLLRLLRGIAVSTMGTTAEIFGNGKRAKIFYSQCQSIYT